MPIEKIYLSVNGGTGTVRHNGDKCGITINIPKNPVVQAVQTVSSGGSSIIYAEVIICISYDDEGTSKYRVRLASDTTADYASGTTYFEGDYAIGSDGLKYVCINDSSGTGISGHDPVEDTSHTYWNEDSEIEISSFYSKKDLGAIDLKDYIPWYIPGQIIKIIGVKENPSDLETTYYLQDELIYTGTAETSSLRWDETNKKLVCVIV